LTQSGLVLINYRRPRPWEAILIRLVDTKFTRTPVGRLSPKHKMFSPGTGAAMLVEQDNLLFKYHSSILRYFDRAPALQRRLMVADDTPAEA
jgi:hypothetical protein